MSMSDEFKIKKISQETLGEYLSSVRAHLGLSLEEVAHKTEIFEKFLAALESGKYSVLPPDVYVVGFLKKIAKLYQISCEELLEQYKKERGVDLQASSDKTTNPSKEGSFWQNLAITPKVITIVSMAVLGAGAFAYILIQVFSVNRTPSLVVLSPLSNNVIEGSSVEIVGQTDPGMTVKVNDQIVLVDKDGKFSTTLGVTPGQKDFRLVATNKFGKQKETLLSLKIDEPKIAGDITQKPTDLQLELKFTKSAKIVISRDGVELPEEEVPAGAIKKVVASDEIIITTSDAGNTQATLNGQKFGSLGKVGQSLTVPFTHEAQNLVSNSNSDSETNK